MLSLFYLSYFGILEKAVRVLYVLVLFVQLEKCLALECFSCSAVENAKECTHRIECLGNEVCYMHSYRTESGSELFDYGCWLNQTCGQLLTNPVFGRREEGHHVRCTQCCNTRLCNELLNCSRTHASLPSILPRECADLKITTSGVYNIYPLGISVPKVPVYCLVDAVMHIWTVIQRRQDGSLNFYRGWEDYKHGFGSPNGEYWLGNDYIHDITEDSNHALKIVMMDFSNVTKYAEYLSFFVSSEANGYQLMVSKFDGDAGDSLTRHNGQKISTHDRDNDVSSSNCAVLYKGAWWYDDCHSSNLNGMYLKGHHDEYATGVNWRTWHDYHYSLKSTTMMVRRY